MATVTTVTGSLDGMRLREAVVTYGSPWLDVEHHATVGSTNARAALVGEPWHVVVADHQSEGRGRLARTWQAPPGTGVAVSATVPVPPTRQGWLPLAAGLAMVDAVEAVTSLRAELKWPNDVLLPADGGRKVCGVLCEVASAAGGAVVVIGAGVNVSQTREQLPVDSATSLALAGATEVDRTALVAAYLTALAKRYASLVAGGPAPALCEEYRARCATIGQRITLSGRGTADLVGNVETVDDEGRLVVLDAAGERRPWSAGDVVHVRPV